jgi:glyoxylase-like metal-dependent hydrolase (beta-lactamase superfamily II)
MFKKTVSQLVVGPIATNCWIYPLGEKKAAIIDPGDQAGKIISRLEQLSLVPRYILLTHGHFDHIAALPQLAQAFAAIKPQIAIHRLDSHYLGAEAYSSQIISAKAAMGDTSFIDDDWREMPPADILLDEGAVIGPFTVLHVPGHTEGSAAFWDKDEGLLFSGDTLFRGAYGRTDLPGGSEAAIIASLNRLFTMEANTVVYPGHGGTTTIGRESKAAAQMYA